MTSRYLTCGAISLRVPEQLLELARARVHTDAFLIAAATGPVVTIERVDSLPVGVGLPLDGSPAPWGVWAREGDTLRVHVPDDVWAAESVLRIAWQVATARQGGVLMHGCGLAWGEKGVAAIGHSGAGKSTLATLSSGVPGCATLLTDEIVQLFPDGTVAGSPFRSNVECVGSARRVRLVSLLLLDKGPDEHLTVVEPVKAAPELLGQLYRTVTEVPQAEQVRRVLSLIDGAGVQRLTFRKDPAVGPFLREFVERSSR